MLTRFGLQIPSFSYPGVEPDALFAKVAEIATTAEGAGFDSLWVMDHFLQIPGVGQVEEPMFEAYTLLGALAARTTTARLGALVTGVTYRRPGVLAKQVTALDVISGGRAVLGIGAAWFEVEHVALGVRFPPLAERFERLEEAITICRAMFREDAPSFEGRHYRIERAYNRPAPITPGGPPILVGGGGERKTLNLVARLADACNLFGDPGTVRHKLDVLRRHCDAVGRDPAEITKTALVTLVVGEDEADAARTVRALADHWGVDEEAVRSRALAGSRDQVVAGVAEYFDAGLDGLIVNMADAHDLGRVELAGRTLTDAFGGRP